MPIRMGEPQRAGLSNAAHAEKVGVCILAAGIARRLEPISGIIAKPAFPLGGRVPIAELWVRKFVEAGLPKMVMNLHRVPDSLTQYFGDGRRFLADLSYVDEEIPSGTLGGAVKMVRKLEADGFHPERVFIPSGDIVSGITREQLETMLFLHTKHGAAITMMLAPIPWERRADFGTAILENHPAGSEAAPGTFARIVDFLEKDPGSPSNLNNASNYLIETAFLSELGGYLTEAEVGLERPFYDFGKHVFMGMKGKLPYRNAVTELLAGRKNDLYGYVPGTLWFDIGNKRDYLAVNRSVLTGEVPVDLPYTRYPWGWMGENTEVDFKAVTINAPVIIGNDCVLSPGTEIGPHVVLGDGWIVRRGAKIRDAVLWPHYGYPRVRNGEAPEVSGAREIKEGVRIETSILVGGVIASDVVGKTVDETPDGRQDIRDIDHIPEGPRA